MLMLSWRTHPSDADALSSIVRLRIPQGDRPSLDEIRCLAAGRAGLARLMELMQKCWEAKPAQRPTSHGKKTGWDGCLRAWGGSLLTLQRLKAEGPFVIRVPQIFNDVPEEMRLAESVKQFYKLPFMSCGLSVHPFYCFLNFLCVLSVFMLFYT